MIYSKYSTTLFPDFIHPTLSRLTSFCPWQSTGLLFPRWRLGSRKRVVQVAVNATAGWTDDMLSSLVHPTSEVSKFLDISECPPALTGNDLSLFSSISFPFGSLLCFCDMLLAFVSVVGVASATASTVAAATVVALSRDFSFWSKVDVRLTSRSLPMGWKREPH